MNISCESINIKSQIVDLKIRDKYEHKLTKDAKMDSLALGILNVLTVNTTQSNN